MAATTPKPRLLAIVGPTASGKSELAIKVANKFNGEIIAADSRTVYRGMDVGTAKPTTAQQLKIRHHGLDLVDPEDDFNAYQFKRYASGKIKEIQKRGNLPILVGGSGLYIDSVLFDYKFSPTSLERDSQNPRHLKRTIQPATRGELRANTLIVGLKQSRDVLKSRLNLRMEQMIKEGFIQEVETVSKRYGWGSNALLAPGYRAFRDYLEGTISLEEAKARFVQYDLNLAKRQWTWFKRNPHIHWFTDSMEAFEYISKVLSTKNIEA
ncbi:MAG: tRNA (adenosine(37)-N6)-dimethylallyltransferase MiaA [Candidatus Saccharimonadales bacterium]